MTRCECELAGFCTRHGVKKPEHWVHLCKTKSHYWKAWEEGRGPGQAVTHSTTKTEEPVNEELRELWREVHMYAIDNFSSWSSNEASKWFKRWFDRIPSFGCSCRNHFAKILKTLPVDTTSPIAFAKRSHEWHCAVSDRLRSQGKDRPHFSWEEFEATYGSPWNEM